MSVPMGANAAMHAFETCQVRCFPASRRGGGPGPHGACAAALVAFLALGCDAFELESCRYACSTDGRCAAGFACDVESNRCLAASLAAAGKRCQDGSEGDALPAGGRSGDAVGGGGGGQAGVDDFALDGLSGEVAIATGSEPAISPRDAGSSVDGPGSGSDASSPPADANVPLPGLCPVADGPPERICLGGECLNFSPAMREALVLWLDPTTLRTNLALSGPDSEMLEIWCDRSGRGNHAIAGIPSPPGIPLAVVADGRGAGPELDRAVMVRQNWLYVDSPDTSLAFEDRDFLILAGETILDDLDAARVPVFYSRTFASHELGLEVNTEYPGQLTGWFFFDVTATYAQVVWRPTDGIADVPQLFGLRGVDSLELALRVDGQLVARERLLSPHPPMIAEPFHESGVGVTASFLDSGGVQKLATLVVFNGELAEADVTATETFLCRQLRTCRSAVATGDAGAASAAK